METKHAEAVGDVRPRSEIPDHCNATTESPGVKRRRIEDILHEHGRKASRIQTDLTYVLCRVQELQQDAYALAFCDRILGIPDKCHRLSNEQWHSLMNHHTDLLKVFYKTDGMTSVILRPRDQARTLQLDDSMIVCQEDDEDSLEEDELIPSSVTQRLSDEDDDDDQEGQEDADEEDEEEEEDLGNLTTTTVE